MLIFECFLSTSLNEDKLWKQNRPKSQNWPMHENAFDCSFSSSTIVLVLALAYGLYCKYWTQNIPLMLHTHTHCLAGFICVCESGIGSMFVTHPTAAGTIVLDCWCRGNSEPATPVTDSRAGRANGAARVCAGHRASAAAGGIRGHPLPASGLNTRFSDRLERTAETSCEWVWRERATLSRHASLDGPPLSRLWACASLARHQTPAPLAGTRAALFERFRAERLLKTSARSVRRRYLSFSYVFIRCIRRIVQPKI